MKQRCTQSLEHVKEGLQFLEILEIKRAKEEENAEKMREQMERDNPKMCNPNEAIPMPYDSGSPKTRRRVKSVRATPHPATRRCERRISCFSVKGTSPRSGW